MPKVLFESCQIHARHRDGAGCKLEQRPRRLAQSRSPCSNTCSLALPTEMTPRSQHFPCDSSVQNFKNPECFEYQKYKGQRPAVTLSACILYICNATGWIRNPPNVLSTSFIQLAGSKCSSPTSTISLDFLISRLTCFLEYDNIA